MSSDYRDARIAARRAATNRAMDAELGAAWLSRKLDAREARARRENELTQRYKTLKAPPGTCWYCQTKITGKGTRIDHVPPLSISDKKTLAEWEAIGCKHLAVPCCGDCNTTLGTCTEWRLGARLAHCLARTARNLVTQQAKTRGGYWTQRSLDQKQQRVARLAHRWKQAEEEYRRRGIDPAPIWLNASDDQAGPNQDGATPQG